MNNTPEETGSESEAQPQELAALAVPQTRFEKILQVVPRVLSSKAHVIFLIGLGVYLVVLPLFGFVVSAKAELVGGNYTNVTDLTPFTGPPLMLVSRDNRRRVVGERESRPDDHLRCRWTSPNEPCGRKWLY